ncbi:MAG: hypothetical protein K0R54_90 [Clostridiaceae bacterium]|jgi:DNA gyrase subunit A|nr:hypothetical protein [Clostridiaceae bacterium]
MINEAERIIEVDYEEEMRKSYLDYAMSVIVSRALADVRDGLKPVHRRILYSAHELGLTPDKPYKKSARIVGDVLGKYHPHGDTSVYEAMVRMAQNFSLAVPLIEGFGNFGSIDGDGAAAMRYTEARMSHATIEMLSDLEKDVIDFTDNFDSSLKEPSVLPAKFPNLLINGTNGIAVGMASYMPTHNTTEIYNAILNYIDNPNITVEGIMKYIKGPDFPTGGIITNKNDLLDIYKTGKGKVRVRAKVEVENAGHGKTNLVVTEIAFSYSGNKSAIIEKISELVRDGKFNELSDVRDESSKDGIRMVLEVKKGINIEKLLTKLYKKTPLEDTIGVKFLVLVDGVPVVLSIKQIIEHFVKFQKEITIRKYRYLLEKDLKKKELQEGLIKAIDVMDTIIEVIRNSENDEIVKNCLVNGKIDNISFKTKKAKKEASTFNFTENQAEVIIDMRLRKLIGLEILKLNEDYKNLLKEIEYYTDVVNNETTLMCVIKDYLKEQKKVYGVKRKTEIDTVETVEYVEEFIEEELVVLIDRFGYIKSIDSVSYNRSNEETIKDFKYTFNAMNTEKLCVFTDLGNLYQIKLTDIPKVKIKEKGIPIDTLAKMGKEEVLLMETFNNVKDKKLMFVTKRGLIKVTPGIEYESVRAQINSTKFEEGDSLSDIKLIDNENNYKYVILTTKKNYALKFDISLVNELKKNSKGVKSIVLYEDDYVENIYLLDKNEEKMITVNGKSVDLKKMRMKQRNQIGVKL